MDATHNWGGDVSFSLRMGHTRSRKCFNRCTADTSSRSAHHFGSLPHPQLAHPFQGGHLAQLSGRPLSKFGLDSCLHGWSLEGVSFGQPHARHEQNANRVQVRTCILFAAVHAGSGVVDRERLRETGRQTPVKTNLGRCPRLASTGVSIANLSMAFLLGNRTPAINRMLTKCGSGSGGNNHHFACAGDARTW